MLNLPTYTCHKTVQAAKINGFRIVEATRVFVDLDGQTDAVEVTQEWMTKHKPVNGGYYVVYADGYTSFSPAEAFEAGYTLA